MRAAEKTFTIVIAMILGWGMLCSQVCGIVCAFSACSVEAKAEQPVHNQESGHCHQHESPSQDSQPEPQQPSGSHDCHTHDAVSSLPPLAVFGADGLNQASPPDALAPFIFDGFPLDHLTGNPAERTSFRSPPRRPLQSILRI